jgi:hypothetical protein
VSKKGKLTKRQLAARRRSISRTRSLRHSARQWARSTGKYVPISGSGSFQKRHFSSKRRGPRMPAQSYCGSVARGVDGELWESRPDSRGVCRWRRV